MNHKIFLIEDNHTEGLLLTLALNNIEDIDITHFTSATKMLDNMYQKPSIAIVDINLPEINGHDLIVKLKEIQPDIKIIVVSAQRDIDTIAKIQEQEVYNYLVKSEGVLKYLKTVINDLIKVIEYDSHLIRT